MRTFYRKSWEVIGWTFFADIYCKACGDMFPDIDLEGNEKHPVFLSDEWEDGVTFCGSCGSPHSEW